MHGTWAACKMRCQPELWWRLYFASSISSMAPLPCCWLQHADASGCIGQVAVQVSASLYLCWTPCAQTWCCLSWSSHPVPCRQQHCRCAGISLQCAAASQSIAPTPCRHQQHRIRAGLLCGWCHHLDGSCQLQGCSLSRNAPAAATCIPGTAMPTHVSCQVVNYLCVMLRLPAARQAGYCTRAQNVATATHVVGASTVCSAAASCTQLFWLALLLLLLQAGHQCLKPDLLLHTLPLVSVKAGCVLHQLANSCCLSP